MKAVEHISGIYAILNKINNKSYIGMSQDIHTRWAAHKYRLNHNIHKNKHLQSAWNKYGESSFDFFVLLECNTTELCKNEVKLIALFNTVNEDYGYNLAGGGEGTVKNNSETSKKRSDSLKRHYRSNPEKAEKRKAAVRKTLQSQEFREFSRQRMLLMHQDEEFHKRFLEGHQNKEYRKKISESHKGMKPCDEAIKKSVEIMSRPVRCVETGVVYPSGIEASRSLPGNVNVNAVIAGQRKTAGGYHWEIA